MVILSAAALAFARFARTRQPVKFVVPGGLTMFGLATLSKMGVLALAAAWVAVVWRVLTRSNRRLALTAIVAMLAIALTQDALWQRVVARISQPEVQLDGVARTSTDVRMMILETAWRGFIGQPFVGLGYANFENYSNTDPAIRASTYGTGYGTHNTYLEVLVEGGLMAFVPFMLHFVLYLVRLKPAWQAAVQDRDVVVAAALAGLLVVLISAAVANVLLHYLFWSTCGVALACLEWAPRREPIREMRAGTPLLGRA
jgi:O-antigen ligase